MRKNARWMKKEDDRILEHLADERWSTPREIARDLDISDGHVHERLRMLWYAGLVHRIWPGAFELTQWGAMYLDGKLDASHQPTPTKDRAL